MRKKKENKPEIKEVLVLMTEEQLGESIEKLTQIYAQVLGWEPKVTRTQSFKQKPHWNGFSKRPCINAFCGHRGYSG